MVFSRVRQSVYSGEALYRVQPQPTFCTRSVPPPLIRGPGLPSEQDLSPLIRAPGLPSVQDLPLPCCKGPQQPLNMFKLVQLGPHCTWTPPPPQSRHGQTCSTWTYCTVPPRTCTNLFNLNPTVQGPTPLPSPSPPGHV